jgi:hypothetical protein
MTKHTTQDFTQLAQAFGLQPVDAARHILDDARLGKQVPRWLRRAARAITRTDSGPRNRTA